jgi:hypothetical protein
MLMWGRFVVAAVLELLVAVVWSVWVFYCK